jgi:DNA repair protein RadC
VKNKQLSSTSKHQGHRQRLRERFFTSGLKGFQDYEVVELLLTLATPRKDCKDSAKAALNRFKTLQGVLEASSSELCEVEGIGPVNQIGIRLIKAVCERYLEKKLISKTLLNNSKALFDYLYHSLSGQPREHFKAIYLDAKNKVIASETLFSGTLTASAVYPREVVAAALGHHAAALIFAHNHPSGDPNPSPEDIELTRQLLFACQVMGITVHEHLVIGDNRYFSFADHGYIARLNREYKTTNHL